MITQLNFSLIQGQDFTRLVIVKDRRSHRIRKCSYAYASMRKDGSSIIIPIDTEISFEGGVQLSIPAVDTYDLTAGVYNFDVVADPWDSPETVAQGTIEVTVLDRITDLGGSDLMLINYTSSTDYRRAVTWTDYYGSLLTVSDARMQAVDSSDNVVLDLSYFDTTPSESEIAALDADKRGYLAPLDGVSLEIHISNMAVIASGQYNFDILAQESQTGDWGKVSSGTLVVSSTITDLSS